MFCCFKCLPLYHLNFYDSKHILELIILYASIQIRFFSRQRDEDWQSIIIYTQNLPVYNLANNTWVRRYKFHCGSCSCLGHYYLCFTLTHLKLERWNTIA